MLGKCVLKHTWLSSALAGGHIAVSVPDRYVAVSLVLFSLKTSEFSECVIHNDPLFYGIVAKHVQLTQSIYLIYFVL